MFSMFFIKKVRNLNLNIQNQNNLCYVSTDHKYTGNYLKIENIIFYTYAYISCIVNLTDLNFPFICRFLDCLSRIYSVTPRNSFIDEQVS